MESDGGVWHGATRPAGALYTNTCCGSVTSGSEATGETDATQHGWRLCALSEQFLLVEMQREPARAARSKGVTRYTHSLAQRCAQVMTNYMHGEEDDEQDGVCSPSADDGQSEVMFASGVQPKMNEVRVCPGRRRRIGKGDSMQWFVCVRTSEHDKIIA